MRKVFVAFGFVICGVIVLIDYGSQYLGLFNRFGRSEHKTNIGMGLTYLEDAKNTSFDFGNMIVDNEELKKAIVTINTKKYLKGLYPDVDFIIKDAVCLPGKSEYETYKITAYIDDPATIDTIFYQCKITMNKIEDPIPYLKGDVASLNITDYSGLTLKTD